MRIFAYMLVFIYAVSCAKKLDEPANTDADFVETKYDTTPVDSFSGGAASADIIQRIRMSSAAYRDSLKDVMAKQKEEQKLKDEEARLKKDAEKSTGKDHELSKGDKNIPESRKQADAAPKKNPTK